MVTPLKDERSEQIRMEYLQQQQHIQRLQKLQLQEQLKLKQQQQQQQQQHNHKNASPHKDKRDQRNDDDLINCILDMKPPLHQQPNYVNTSINNYQNMANYQNPYPHHMHKQQTNMQQQPQRSNNDLTSVVSHSNVTPKKVVQITEPSVKHSQSHGHLATPASQTSVSLNNKQQVGSEF